MMMTTHRRIKQQQYQQYKRLTFVLILLSFLQQKLFQLPIFSTIRQQQQQQQQQQQDEVHIIYNENDCRSTSCNFARYYAEAFVIITHPNQNRHGHYQRNNRQQWHEYRLLPNDIVVEESTALGVDIDTSNTNTGTTASIVVTDDIDKTSVSGTHSSNNGNRNTKSNSNGGAITMTINELSTIMGSSKIGRAQLVWDCYRLGIDPELFYSTKNKNDSHEDEEMTSIRKLLPSSRRKLSLGIDSLYNLASTYLPNHQCIENDIVTLIDSKQQDILSSNANNQNDITKTIDLTTKLIIQLYDKLQIETVIIPSYKYNRTTICISSQVGCIQQCQFCATGTMGKFRSLSSNEIVGQFFLSQQYIRQFNYNNSLIQNNLYLPSISNVVFMGMGEPADNIINVQSAVRILTSNDGYQLSSTRVTVSTVAPTPQSFAQLFIFNNNTTTTSTTLNNSTSTNINTNCMIAWSVHSVNDTIRKLLVPTTKYKMIELRQGLIDVLNTKPIQFRTIMIEIVLISNLNDNIIDATQLALFCQVILQTVQHCKLIVNLIPYNEISIPNELSKNIATSKQPAYIHYKKPSMERVFAFQKELFNNNIYTHIRTPRGDTEAAACGQLVTNNKSKNNKKKKTTNFNNKNLIVE